MARNEREFLEIDAPSPTPKHTQEHNISHTPSCFAAAGCCCGVSALAEAPFEMGDCAAPAAWGEPSSTGGLRHDVFRVTLL